VLLDEGLVWRQFQNRRQIGGLLGFAPTPYSSGNDAREQGISRAGHERLQAISSQLAWNWVRWQPASALTQWYRAHFGRGKRARRIGIVALARKLVIALWRYVTQGVVPTGAIGKVAYGSLTRVAASRARGVYGPRRVIHKDRRGEGTAAPVFGSRLTSLWEAVCIGRARIEGEDWTVFHDSDPNPREIGQTTRHTLDRAQTARSTSAHTQRAKRSLTARST
jgi:hypothetical protein